MSLDPELVEALAWQLIRPTELTAEELAAITACYDATGDAQAAVEALLEGDLATT